MGKKSDDRKRKKILLQEKFEASKAAFVSKVTAPQSPITRVQPVTSKTPRVAPHLERHLEEATKKPKAIEDGGRYDSLVTWCITKADREDQWSWLEPRDWTEQEWHGTINPAFNNFANLTWREIDRQSSGTGHKMHHSHEIGDIHEEAQVRWKELDLEQYDTIFRFRLGGTRRAWGYVLLSHFYFVWWERRHMIYQTTL